jgi:uncharacterized protein YwlG (UPF0340 family)
MDVDDRSCPSLEGRRFGSVAEVEGGEVGVETVFDYREDDGLIWASYTGGHVKRGYLVGTRDGDELDFRYVHVNQDRESASGHCRSQLELLDDGRIRMHETWAWESKAGAGTSTVEELTSSG